PSLTIVPIYSWPGVKPRLNGSSPSIIAGTPWRMISMSVAHTAIASIRTSTSARPGSGTGFSMSDSSSGPPSTHAFMRSGMGYWLLRKREPTTGITMFHFQFTGDILGSSVLSRSSTYWVTLLLLSCIRPFPRNRFPCPLTAILHQRNGNPERKREIELARDKGKNGRRAVRNYCPFNAIQVGTTRLPVLWIAHQLDRFVWLVGNELEGPGTDGTLPHCLWRYVAG